LRRANFELPSWKYLPNFVCEWLKLLTSIHPKLEIYTQYKLIKVIILIMLMMFQPLKPVDANGQNIPAFPGALGGGMYTSGGRNGKVIKVSNLNDSGPGSFREALNTKGPRTVVFDVSGTIEIKSQIRIKNGDLTIAGQTAPGDGICIKGHGVRLDADNIIIRFMRFRPGDISESEYDALTGIGLKNIMIDHCSMSWSTDETVSFYDNQNFTLQYSIISESLNNSVHQKGLHGYGGIWGGNNASFIFNLLAHHNSRNPRFQGARDNPADGIEKAEVFNNIVFNWGDKAMYGGEEGYYNIVNNIFIPGPATSKSSRDEILEPYEPLGKFYLDGNVFITEKNKVKDANWEHVSLPVNAPDNIRSDSAFFLQINSVPLAVKQACKTILKYSGASLSRDKIDQRIVREAKNRSYTYGNAGIINSQQETEGWPILKSETAKADENENGIPDEWEMKKGIDPKNSDQGTAVSLHSYYTNLEVYMNELVESLYIVDN
jgi:hypothetical protein